jgi:hypothetical protein
MEQRRQEILAKKAKLAELKRQRELRRQESSSRQSLNPSPFGDVRYATCAGCVQPNADKLLRSWHQHQGEAKTSNGQQMSTSSSTVSLEIDGQVLLNLAPQLVVPEQHDPRL